jgi:hypothetical protein
MPAAAGSFARMQFRENRPVFTSGSGHPIYRWTCSLGKIRCPAIWRLFSSGCSAAWSHRRAHSAADAAGRIGRRWPFGDQRRALRSRQFQRAQRTQRHQQRVEDPAASYKLAAAAARLRTHRLLITVTRGRALRGRVAAHLQRRSGNSGRPSVRRRGRPQVRKFTGICRGC